MDQNQPTPIPNQPVQDSQQAGQKEFIPQPSQPVASIQDTTLIGNKRKSILRVIFEIFTGFICALFLIYITNWIFLINFGDNFLRKPFDFISHIVSPAIGFVLVILLSYFSKSKIYIIGAVLAGIIWEFFPGIIFITIFLLAIAFS